MILHCCFFWIAYILNNIKVTWGATVQKTIHTLFSPGFFFYFQASLCVWHSTTCLFYSSIASFTAVSVETTLLIADFKVKLLLLKAASVSAHYCAEWVKNLSLVNTVVITNLAVFN